MAQTSSLADQEIELERQTHLRTIDLLDRVANGETAAAGLLPADLLEDPLDAHLLYVRWTLDTYGSQEENLKKHLIIILEQSTRRFVNDKRYRSDLRYLKLWVLYARNCSKLGATKIYEYLHSKGIGVDFGMFYEEWASAIDQNPAHAKTIEKILDLGIQRGAEPLKRLKKKKLTILQRVSQATSDVSPQPAPPNHHEFSDDPLKNHRALTTLPSSVVAPQNPAERLPKKPPAPTAQKLSSDLSKLYPGNGIEISPEEYKASRQYGSRQWGIEPWEVEAFTSGNWYHFNLDGSPVLYDPITREPLFDYLKPSSSSSSSEMQLSDDDQVGHELLHSKSMSPGGIPPTTDGDQSMADSETIENFNFANITSSTDHDQDDDISAQEAIADAEISINLDSPVRNGTVGYIKPRDRRASVTMNTQEALNEVYNMYGKPAKNSDDSDDNFDNSEAGDDDRLYDENTAYTVAGVRDATADVTFWSHPQKNIDPTDENQLQQSNSTPFQDENALACRQPINGLSQSLSSGQSRGLGAFKPVRKPLAPVIPFPDENEISATPLSDAKPTHSVLEPSGSKRIPLAVKAAYPQQPPINHESLDDPEPDSQAPRTNEFEWQPESPSNEFNTPDIQKDMPLFPSQEDYQSDLDRDYEAEYEDEEYPIGDDVDREGRLIARPLRFVPTGDNFNALTPITERTSEYNSMTAPRYINRIQDAQFALHRQTIGKFPGVVFQDDDEEAELTPKPNHMNEENSGQDSSYCSEILPDPRIAGHVLAGACEVRDSPTRSSQYQLHHSLETPSKIAAQLHHHASLPRAPDSQSGLSTNDHEEDSIMTSPSRPYSKQSVPPTPNPIQACKPCNPFAPDIVNILLEGLDPPLESYHGYQSLVDHRSDKLQQLRKRCKTRDRKHSHSNLTAEEASWEVELGGDLYIIYEKLGEGTYGSVFRVSEAVGMDCAAIPHEDNSIQKAMKVESPPNLYEFSILSQLHQTLSERLCESIIKPHKLYAYADESYLVMDYSDQGTLLDIVNRAGEIGIKPTAPGIVRGVEELVAMFFTIELMRVVEGLHDAGYIHGDLKVDNCMVRLESLPGESKSWSSTYDPQGLNGWGYKGLKLIDYGRAINTRVFPPSQEFIAEWETDEFDCLEMRTGKPWTFQPDYHGILGIAHCLLFGSFMTEKDSLKPAFKRYHQVDLWNSLFDVCLSPQQIPNSLHLRSVRLSMEDWLQQNCEKGGKSLKGLLKKIEVASASFH